MQGFIKTLEVPGLVRTELSERKKRCHLADKGERVLKTYLSLHKQIDSLAPSP
jgi:predicted transcriptional regulator